jgi:hypothetical protein
MIAMGLGLTTGRYRCHGDRCLQDREAQSEAFDANTRHVPASEQETGQSREVCLLCCCRLMVAAPPDPGPRTRSKGLCSCSHPMATPQRTLPC